MKVSIFAFKVLFLTLFFSVSVLAEDLKTDTSASSPAAGRSNASEISGGFDVFLNQFRNAPKEFTLMPFWFWNDTLDEAEIVRQIADFEAHGVYGFVIHPRIGLPEDSGWMSPRLLSVMRTALEEAKRRGMYVLLYDEGMYPSGSSAGQVAAKNPRYAARGFSVQEVPENVPTEKVNPHPEPLWDLVTVLSRPNGKRIAIYERPSKGVIRGLHYLDEGTPRQREFLPPAGDILSPEAARCFRELVYDRFYQEFGEYFGSVVLGIFTDEPSELGRGHARGVVPGNAYALKKVSERLGYDFTPYLGDLWFKDTPESEQRRHAYLQALHLVLVETYYQPLSEWCLKHGVGLCGHPGNSNDMISQSVFQIPGQDIVWRYVEPGGKALYGAHSTNAKAASSAMTHGGRTRNLNELYGAYGHNLTFEEVKWLANWVLVRGQNMLVPHAFYYSIRGPRHDERPPDVGPNSPWWNDGFREYADACRRLSWLNTGKPVIRVAVLTDGVAVPDQPVRPLFESQLDFNYLDMAQLLREGKVDEAGLHIAGMTYRAVVLPSGRDAVPEGFYESPQMVTLKETGRLVTWQGNGKAEAYTEQIRRLVSPSSSSMNESETARNQKAQAETKQNLETQFGTVRVTGENASGIRVRHLLCGQVLCLLLFNETDKPAEITLSDLPNGSLHWLNAETGEACPCESTEKLPFQKFEMKILTVSP